MLVTRFFRGISLNRFATASIRSCSVISLIPAKSMQPFSVPRKHRLAGVHKSGTRSPHQNQTSGNRGPAVVELPTYEPTPSAFYLGQTCFKEET
jgi:hypothetical protein